jgi:predicted nucleic acid-binding protein
MSFLVDTNVISELPKRRPDRAVLEWFARLDGFALSTITIEELSYGIARAPAAQRERLVPWFERLLAIPPILVPVDERIARAAGELRAARTAAGHPAAQADLLIAASALVTGRALVTRNTRHFEGCGVALLDPFSDRSSIR